MTATETCIFCNIPPEIDARIIYEDDLIRSFLSDPQLTRGHTLVVPIRHIEPPEPLKFEEAQAITTETERLRINMLNNLGRGVDIFQKSRPDIPEGHNGTKINHLHYHVLPSNPGDEMYDRGLMWTPDHFLPLNPDEMAELVPVLQRGTVNGN